MKYPYDYKSIPLRSVKGSATYEGNPSPELIGAVNAMAELAFNKTSKMKQKITPEATPESVEERGILLVKELKHKTELAIKEGSAYHETAEARTMAFNHGWDACKEYFGIGKWAGQATPGIETLLAFLAQYGGEIVSTAKLTPEWINQAKASGRLYVDENSLGYVWEPDIDGFPTTEQKVEEFEKWYPLDIELPESLKNTDWIFDKLHEKKLPATPASDKSNEADELMKGLINDNLKLVAQVSYYEMEIRKLSATKSNEAIERTFTLDEMVKCWEQATNFSNANKTHSFVAGKESYFKQKFGIDLFTSQGGEKE